MPGLTCNACHKEFLDDGEQKLHYKSDWHRYNLECKTPQPRDRNDEESEDEWLEVDPEEDLVDHVANSLNALNLNEEAFGDEADTDNEEEEELDPCCCFMCDLRHGTFERCILHMHKFHGLFIPDVEYLKDPQGLLTYLGLKVKRDFMCLYCNERCHPFGSLEAVRKHMAAKGHCRVHYGDGDEDEEGELEDFYDYSSSYVDESGKKLIVADDMSNIVELGSGLELVLTCRRSDQEITTKILGYREYSLYYRQMPRPSAANKIPTSVVLAARQRSMVLAYLPSREQIVKKKAKRAMERSAIRAMRRRIRQTRICRKLSRR